MKKMKVTFVATYFITLNGKDETLNQIATYNFEGETDEKIQKDVDGLVTQEIIEIQEKLDDNKFIDIDNFIISPSIVKAVKVDFMYHDENMSDKDKKELEKF